MEPEVKVVETPPATTEVSPKVDTPVVPAVETPPAGGEDSAGSELFTELADDTGDSGEGEEAPPTPAVSTPRVETPPKVDITPAPTVDAPPKVEEPAKTDTPTPVVSEEDRKAQYDKDRAAAIARLTEQYAISEEQTPALITEPEKVLPVLMANMHARVMENVVSYLQQALPHAVRQVSSTETVQQAAAAKFFTEWPELNKPEFGESVARVLAGYRQANPKASQEDVIREGGVAALVSLRIPIPDRVLTRHNVDRPDATKGAAFTPAPTGAARGAPVKGPENTFSILAQEDLQDQ